MVRLLLFATPTTGDGMDGLRVSVIAFLFVIIVLIVLGIYLSLNSKSK